MCIDQDTNNGKSGFLSFLPLDEVATWAFCSVYTQDSGLVVVQAIIQKKGIAVCDGSFQDEIGTAAWIIKDGTEHGCTSGVTWVPGLPKDQCAFEANLQVYTLLSKKQTIFANITFLKEGQFNLGVMVWDIVSLF